jgi:peptide chain release factor 2
MATLRRSSDAQLPGVTLAADDLGSFRARRDDHGDPAHRADATIEPWQNVPPSSETSRRSRPSSPGSVITFDPDAQRARVGDLERAMGEPGFWEDQGRAARISSEQARLARRLERYDRLKNEADDLRELATLSAEDGELDEVEENVRTLKRELDRLQEDALFTGEYDAGDAVVSIHAGTGGTDAQDWAEILLRMYLRWAADRGFRTELLEASPGEEAGLKSATFTVHGENAYGILKAERGVHRLVRLSPFDQAHRRHTSFAQVVVSPLVSEDVDIELDEADLRVDTYRASGAGGQHVNKTDSAVRITHVPTGIVVQCQNERSQLSNRQTALRILKSRLAEHEEEKREAELARERGVMMDTGFGSQIRSYVLHPYQLVKDHRTNVEEGNAQAVLDGRLDDLIHGYLLAKAAGTAP